MARVAIDPDVRAMQTEMAQSWLRIAELAANKSLVAPVHEAPEPPHLVRIFAEL